MHLLHVHIHDRQLCTESYLACLGYGDGPQLREFPLSCLYMMGRVLVIDTYPLIILVLALYL